MGKKGRLWVVDAVGVGVSEWNVRVGEYYQRVGIGERLGAVGGGVGVRMNFEAAVLGVIAFFVSSCCFLVRIPLCFPFLTVPAL